MRRPVKLASRQGLLLIEAILSAAVIGVGLVLISRALSGQLHVLQTVQDYDALLSLAQGKLLELESQHLSSGKPLPDIREGTFESPYQTYHWSVIAKGRLSDPLDANGNPLTSEVTLTVEQEGQIGRTLQLSAIWPNDWIPAGW